LVYIVVFVLAFFSPNRKSDGWANWRLALLWCTNHQLQTGRHCSVSSTDQAEKIKIEHMLLLFEWPNILEYLNGRSTFW